MKIVKILLTGMSALMFLGMAQIASAETLRVGMECTYAPFNFKNASGELDISDITYMVKYVVQGIVMPLSCYP